MYVDAFNSVFVDHFFHAESDPANKSLSVMSAYILHGGGYAALNAAHFKCMGTGEEYSFCRQ